MAQSDWKDQIYIKLSTIFADNVETFTRILYYLNQEELIYKDNAGEVCPAWRTLKLSLNSDKVFKSYSERLAEDTKKAQTDVEFRKTMGKVYAQMMDPSDEPLPEELSQHWDIARLADMNVATTSGFMGLASAWGLIPISTQIKILEMIPRIITNKQVLNSIDDIVGLVNKAGGNVVMVGLATIHIGFDAYRNLKRWWNGEISGTRCAKNIVDSIFSIMAGVAGGVGGAALGSLIGPIGTFAGGIIGGIISSQTANLLIDRITQTIFGIPKEESLEKAYNFFGVNMTASNHEINTSFRKLCLQHHPDKGGNSDQFLIVQLHMGVIKLARGDLN